MMIDGLLYDSYAINHIGSTDLPYHTPLQYMWWFLPGDLEKIEVIRWDVKVQ